MWFTVLKPSVPKQWLIAAAGIMWSLVGIMLCTLAVKWLSSIFFYKAILLGCVGMIGAGMVYRFGFSKIALKNINRLHPFPEKACFFAFQAWKSYFLIGGMILLGICLRHSPVPKYYLAVVYLTIGGALFLSSYHYYIHLWRELFHRQNDSRNGR